MARTKSTSSLCRHKPPLNLRHIYRIMRDTKEVQKKFKCTLDSNGIHVSNFKVGKQIVKACITITDNYPLEKPRFYISDKEFKNQDIDTITDEYRDNIKWHAGKTLLTYIQCISHKLTKSAATRLSPAT